MKLQKTFIIGLAMLFSACSGGAESYQTERESVPETEWEDPALMPVKLSERDISGYTFKGSVTVNDDESGTRTVYSGYITDSDDISEAEDFIDRIEALPCCDTDEYYGIGNDHSAFLSLENNGERYTYTEKSFTENGVRVSCILRRGTYSKDTVCIRFEDSGENSLCKLTEKLIAKEDNIAVSEKYPEKSDAADIVLISEYKNRAWGYQHSGSFIDINGNVFDFDFSADTYGGEEIGSEVEFISRLTEICLESEPEPDAFGGHTDTLRQIRELADGADRNAKLISVPDCFDAGQSTVYAVTSENRLVIICSAGDNIVTSTDENALEIQKLLEK